MWRRQNIPISSLQLKAKGVAQPSLELGYDEGKYLIDLPRPGDIVVLASVFRQAIEKRASRRSYLNKPLSLEELSFLLWCTQGVKEVFGGEVVLRTVPSAGARHAFEACLLINKVKGLKPGLYRFLALKHKLIDINLDSGIAAKVTGACLDQAMIAQSAVTFIWVAVAERMCWRYS